MPRTSGVELAGQMSHERAKGRVLLMSGYSDEVALGELLAHGVAVLPKPFTPSRLLQGVRRVLDSEEAGEPPTID